MAYFVTGATGFIGRHLIQELCLRGEPIYVLVRSGSGARMDRLLHGCGPRSHLITPIQGDLSGAGLCIGEQDRQRLAGQISHFFHLGALYDLGAAAADLEVANVRGTRNAVSFANEIRAQRFHHVSSIAAAGCYSGIFTEDMFQEAQALDHPYFRTKHDSEAVVREMCRMPWRIYRPGMVVGHSGTGEMDKIDGPYYLFKLIQKLRDVLPRWMPLVGLEGGYINVVPVDYVAAALAYLAHAPEQDGRCFHLTDPRDRRLGEVINLFCRAAHAPEMTLRLGSQVIEQLPSLARAGGTSLEPWCRIGRELLRDLGIEPSILTLLNYPIRFDSHRTQELLAAAHIRVPCLEDYAWRLWDYWERILDPDLPRPDALAEHVRGKVVLITGGSSGIGRATALKVARAGARVLLVARDPVKLSSVSAQIAAEGGDVHTYVCDLADAPACERFLAQLREDQDHIDILINNAGHSIRRAIENTYDRLHDYERLMRINYFAAVHVTLGLLPRMVSQAHGHVINISSIGVLSHAARFAAYNASKAALEAFSRTAAAEYRDKGIRFTVINMPLVRTPMVAPTKLYDQFPLIQAEQAADIVCKAIIRRPERLASGLGTLAQLVETLVPAVNAAVMSECFHLFPESEAAGGAHQPQVAPAKEALSLAALMHGVSA